MIQEVFTQIVPARNVLDQLFVDRPALTLILLTLYTLYMTCTQRVLDLYTTCTQLVHDLYTV